MALLNSIRSENSRTPARSVDPEFWCTFVSSLYFACIQEVETSSSSRCCSCGEQAVRLRTYRISRRKNICGKVKVFEFFPSILPSYKRLYSRANMKEVLPGWTCTLPREVHNQIKETNHVASDHVKNRRSHHRPVPGSNPRGRRLFGFALRGHEGCLGKNGGA